MGTDRTVWDVTKDAIIERVAVAPEDAWGGAGTALQPLPQKGLPDPMSDFIRSGGRVIERRSRSM